MEKSKSLYEPTLADKDEFLRLKGIEKIKSVVMKDISWPDDPQGYEAWYFPFDRKEFDSYLSEEDIYWTEDRDQMWTEVEDALDWFADDWEEYCEDKKWRAWEE